MQDTKVEWGYLGKGATGVMTMWLGRACPMVIKHVHPGMRQIWVQIPSSTKFQLYNPMLVNFSLMPFFTLSLSKFLFHSYCQDLAQWLLRAPQFHKFWICRHYLKISICKSCIWVPNRFIIVFTAQTVGLVPLLSLKQLLHVHTCSFPSILSFLMWICQTLLIILKSFPEGFLLLHCLTFYIDSA